MLAIADDTRKATGSEYACNLRCCLGGEGDVVDRALPFTVWLQRGMAFAEVVASQRRRATVWVMVASTLACCLYGDLGTRTL